MDRAAHLVASVQMLAQQRLEATGETNSFYCLAEEGAFVKAWRGKTAHHV
jgi:hypothetical protein